MAEVGVDADLVIVCVFTDEQVRAVCLDGELLARMPAGSTLVVHTTASPATAEAVATRAAVRGIGVLDAAISGGPHDIAAGQLTLYVGGDKDTFDRTRPALAAYGDPILHVGAIGAGLRTKLVNNALFAAQLGLLADAVALAAHLGITEHALLEALSHGSSGGRVIDRVAARGSLTEFTTAVGGFLDKDVAVVERTAAELGGDLGALGTAIRARRGVEHA
ncbi:NAD(P)-dependent oxidoreductase [Nocardia callitridis]|uniref:NAD(P)-dependent oxidoreductase n=1 Tax=Nocardia callitridis TaxID=648753 RepID=A0ABP9KA69_9NOCA